MPRRSPRRYALHLAALVCGLATVASPAEAERHRAASSAASAVHGSAIRLSLPRPTGRDAVGVRAGFLLDRARPDPETGRPRAIPIRVWYPAKRHHGPAAPYFAPAVQEAVEADLTAPPGMFDIDTHATLAAPARHHVRGVLLVTGGFGTPVAAYTGLVSELASRGYALVAFDHPHETAYVEQPVGPLIPNDLPDDEVAFEARLLDISAVLDALRRLVPMAGRHTPVGIFGHSNGGAAAGEAMVRHRELRAGVNLDGFIPGGSFLPSGRLLTEGLDRPFGVMLSAGQPPEDLEELETFLSNMRAPHPVKSLDIQHNGFTDFVVFNPQAQRADPEIAATLEAVFTTGTLDDLAAGRRALGRQREFLVRFFDRYL
jgi:pimeloyl-ACP methyl ester carboxylesterase